MQRKIVRGTTHERDRPPTSTKHVAGKDGDSLTLRKITETGLVGNWLGHAYFTNHNNNTVPSLNQVSHGLVTEAIHQLELAMGDVLEQKHKLAAKANIVKTWEDLLNEGKINNRDEPLGTMFPMSNICWRYLDGGVLLDPKSAVVGLILYIYQMENFCYAELNKACRYKDESKVLTLGPWAFCLNVIISHCGQNRKDVSRMKLEMQNDLWRGGGIPQEGIDDYKK